MALGSGAARGLAHIGVLEVLQRESIPIDMIAGASAGALIGAICAQGKDCSLVKDLAISIDLKRMISLVDPVLAKSGLIGGRKVINLLRGIIGEDVKFEDLKIPFACVATDIITGEEVVIRRGSVLEAIRASMAIPGIFTIVKLNDRYLADGILVNPVPVNVVKEMGADFVIAVNVVPHLNERASYLKDQKSKPTSKAPNIFSVMMQSLYIGTYALVRSSLEGADVVIQPKVAQIHPTEFNRAQEMIRQGELAAKAAIPEIKRLLGAY